MPSPLSTDLLGWFTPTPSCTPLFGGDLVAGATRRPAARLDMGVTGFRDVNTVFLGWGRLALAIVGMVVYRARLRIWIWTTSSFSASSRWDRCCRSTDVTSSTLTALRATFPLPFALLHYLPVIKANRAPNRNSVLLMLGLAVLAGFGAYWLIEQVRVVFAAAPCHPHAHPHACRS